MGIYDVLNRFKTESKGLCEAREIKEKAEAMTEGKKKIDVESMNSPKLRKIAADFNRMDTSFWENMLAKQAEGLNACDYDKREGFINQSIYELERMEAIYKSYEKILKEPHHVDEYLKKLTAGLKKLEEQFDKKTQEQMRIDDL